MEPITLKQTPKLLDMHVSWRCLLVVGLLLILPVLKFPLIIASPDADSIPELRIDGPSTVLKGSTLQEIVQLDDDIPGNQVGGVLFTLTIPQICKDNATDPNRGMRLIIDPVWDQIASFNVLVPEGTNDHQVTVVAAASNNVDTTNGRNLVSIQCTVDVTGSKTVTQNFTNILVSKFDPANPGSPIAIQVLGEPKDITAQQITKGDLNGDGKITVADIIIASDCLSGKIVCTPEQLFAADVFPAKDPSQGRQTCGDGVFDLNDLLVLTDIALGRISIADQCG